MTVEAGIGRLLADEDRDVWPDGRLRSAFLVGAGWALTAWHCIADIGGTDAQLWLRLQPRDRTEHFIDIPVRYFAHDPELDTALLAVGGDTEMRDYLASVALPPGRDVEAYEEVRVAGSPQRNRALHAVPFVGTVQSADALIGNHLAIRVMIPAFAARYAEWPDRMSGGPLLRRSPGQPERAVGIVVSYPRISEGEGAAGGNLICRRMADICDRFPVVDSLVRQEPRIKRDQPISAAAKGTPSTGDPGTLSKWKQKQASRWLIESLEHIRADELEEAEASLARIEGIQDALSAQLRRMYLYDAACIESLKADEEWDPQVIEGLVENGLAHLHKWISEVVDGAWEDGLDPYNEMYKMSRDSDLHSVLRLGRDVILQRIPDELKKAFAPYAPTKHYKGGGGGGVGGCFPAGSLVHTPHGRIPIEQVREGQEILSVMLGDECRVISAHVKEVHFHRAAQRLLVDGDLVTTPTQPVCLLDGTYVPAGELAEGSQLLTVSPGGHTVQQVSIVPGRVEVYSLTTDHSSHNYVVAGFVCHNFPKYYGG